jgi:hypothetical protein
LQRAPTMAPIMHRDGYYAEPANELREQMMHPSDVFSVLLLLGGDVVAKALAQVAGCGFAPVTFSFGKAFHVRIKL